VLTADAASEDSGQQTECGGLIEADGIPDLCSGPLDRAAGGGTRRDDSARRGVDTVFTGQVKDQSQLYGLLNRLQDLGLELISVQPLPEAGRATDENQTRDGLLTDRSQ
jgi:hypothetical protein